MSVLKAYFDSSLNQSSPIQKDFNRVVNIDETGNEYISWEEVDYSAIQKSNGSASDWSLNSLLAAGINPNFPIHTSLNTRLEGIGVVKDAVAIADEILSDNDSTPKND